MKLNNKGYMLVEIIVSFSIAMAIAFYLINLTYKFKNNNDEIYQSSLYMKDKISITKNIMNDLENKILISDGSSCKKDITELQFEFDYKKDDESVVEVDDGEESVNHIIKLAVSGNTLKYGELASNSNQFNDRSISYYEKTVEKSLRLGKITCEKKLGVVTITIPLSSIYSSDDTYDIKLVGFLDE